MTLTENAENTGLSLTLPPASQWLPALDACLRQYLLATGFTGEPADRAATSAIEAAEELVRICGEQNVNSPFSVEMRADKDAVTIRICYSTEIPLRPHETELYSAPDSEAAVTALNTDGLWLHLIKSRMDRLYFRTEGGKCALEMIKYRRAEGKSRQYWVMGLSPRLRAGVTIDASDDALTGSAVLHDPDKGFAMKLDKGAAFIVSRMDGRRSIKEIYMEYVEKIGMISPQALGMLFEKIEDAGLLETVSRPGKPSGIRDFFYRFVSADFSIPKPDELSARLLRLMRPLVGPAGAAFLFLAGISGILPLAAHFDRFKETLLHFLSLQGLQPRALAWIYPLMLATLLLHEAAHALACKRFGGRVGRMGVMLYLAAVVFYCDTTSSWRFQRIAQRVWVYLAGPLTTFALAGVFLWAFAASIAGSTAETVWGAAALFSALTLLMNMNPFIKMDAYYVLVDLSGITDLRERSFEYLSNILFRRRDKGKAGNDAPAAREKIAFAVYGVLGAVMTVVVSAAPLAYLGWVIAREGRASRVLLILTGLVLLSLMLSAREAFLRLRSARARRFALHE